MPNINYVAQGLDGEQIEAALTAIDGVVSQENNGKVLAIENGKIVAKSASEWTDAPVLEPVTIIQNGTITPPTGVDGFNSVTVAVPGAGNIEPLSVTENGTYNPPSGVDGYAPVTVNVSGGSGSYDLLEYIDSDGTQAIDTGIKPNQGDILSVRVQALSGNDAYNWVIGSWYSSTRYAGILYAAGVTRSYDGNGASTVLYNGIDTANSHVYSVTCNNSSASTVNAHVFAIKDNSGTLQNFSKARLFFVLVGEALLIPARRKSDNVCGLLDITNNNFLMDVASGNAFGAGPVLPT